MTPGGICFPEGKACPALARRGREGTRRAAAEAQPKRRTRAQRGLRSRPSPCRPSRSAGSKPPLLFSFLHHAWTLDSPRQLLASLELVAGCGGWRRRFSEAAAPLRRARAEPPWEWACGRPGFVAAPTDPGCRRLRQRPYHASRRAVYRLEQRADDVRVVSPDAG